jgi:hypothetical protein
MRYTFVKQHDATDCAAACFAKETRLHEKKHLQNGNKVIS